MENNLIHKKPLALERLGAEVFIDVPLYEAKEKYSPLYINETLFSQYFQDNNTNYGHMAQVIQQYFSTTIDPNKAEGKPIGTAYVDKQADPLKISLNNNLGSGRAFYQYDIFNIKGEKTPLAQSERDEYSNGVLELEKSIFETVASNSLYQDANIQLSPILAILDINENCTVHWKNKLCKRAKVIRLDLNGSLNRITHIFQTQRPLTRNELRHTARKIGIMEGEKFLHRIEHGAWSAGNLSEHAHMIDFDTVCAARYRAPQFSFTKWFIDNYFGLEYIGQLKILKSMVEATEINIDRVRYATLEKDLLEAREKHIHQNFAQLMGFEKVSSRHLPAITPLVNQFIKLSTLCYPEPAELELKYLESQFCSPFNFSKFFRFYPILRRRPDWDAYLGLEYLIDCVREFAPFDLNALEAADEDERFFNTTVLKRLDDYFIHSEAELLERSIECLKFIQDYDTLYTQLLEDNSEAQGKIETKALIINEDRRHMLMPLSMAGPIDDERDRLPYERIHQVIKHTIRSNQRSGKIKQNGLLLSNMEIFKEGYFATMHNQQHQHRLSINFFENAFPFASASKFRIQINEQSYPCQVRKAKGITSIQSPFFDNLNLLENQYWEILFFQGDNIIGLNNFMFSFTETEQTYNFVEIIN